MIHYVDNFLPQDQFDALAKRVQGRFGTGDTSVLKQDSDEPVRITLQFFRTRMYPGN